jgi:tetratricopeptide (TPR) repeat protein
VEVRLHLEMARVMHAMARPEEAIRHYTAARAIRPETAHDLAHVLHRRGDTDAAIAVFRDLTRRRPTNAIHTVCLSYLLVNQRRFGEVHEALITAVAANREAIRLRPGDANAYQSLGIALEAASQPEDAIAAFRETIRLMPEESTAHIYLGQIFDRMNRRSEAIDAYREAIRLRPDDAEAHVRLGDTLLMSRRDGDAVAAYGEALRLDPHGWAAHVGLGVSLIRQGHWREGAAEYELARACFSRMNDDSNFHFPVLPWTTEDAMWYVSAVAQLRAGRIDVYQKLRDEMLARFGDGTGDVERVARLGLMWPDGREAIAKAIPLAERVFRANPTSIFVQYTASLAAYRSGRFEVALERLSRRGGATNPAIKVDFRPNYDCLSELVRAMALARLGRPRPARDSLVRAERMMSEYHSAEDSAENYPYVWQEWAHCEIIHREARAVVEDAAFPADPFAP